MRQRQHDDGQDEEFQRAVTPAADRKPGEMDAEDQLQDRRDQEVRQNDAYQDQGAQNVIRRLVLIERPKTADEDADDDGDEESGGADGEGIGQADHDLLRDGEVFAGK